MKNMNMKKRYWTMNLQVFAGDGGDDDPGDEGGDDDNDDPGDDDDDSGDDEPEENEKKFSQKDVDDAVKKRLAREKRKVEVELERYAKEHNDPTLEDSYFILHDEYNEELDYDVWADYRPQGAVVFTSKQLVFDAIESIGRDRIIKYIFGVESEGEE